jgi:hypothetical protein
MKKLLVFIAFLFWVPPVFSAPTISSVSNGIIHGASITISGSDFGTKPTAAPLRWDNFDSETTGQKPGESGGWWSDQADNNTEITTDAAGQRHSNSTKSVKCAMPATGIGGAYFYKTLGTQPNKIFVSFWGRLDWGEPDGDGSWQIKFFRLNHDASGGSPVYPTIPMFAWVYDTPQYRASWSSRHYLADCTASTTPASYTQDLPTTSQDPSWLHVTIWVDQSTITAVDWGTYLSRHNFSDAYYSNSEANTDLENDGAACQADKLDSIFMGGSHESGGQGSTIYYDDIYIDTSWARVEIGDNATYASCTHREIQIPSAWSDTEITATINRGSFTTETVYLFVVDADGAVSEGYAVGFGATSITGVGSTTITGEGSTTIGE